MSHNTQTNNNKCLTPLPEFLQYFYVNVKSKINFTNDVKMKIPLDGTANTFSFQFNLDIGTGHKSMQESK